MGAERFAWLHGRGPYRRLISRPVGLALPVVWSDRHRLHEPGGEVWVGVRTPGTELPERAERIREALSGQGASFVHAEPQPDEAATSVHDPALVAYLARAWEDWEASGLTEDPGQDRVVPYLFPHPALFSDRLPRTATAMSARAGQFAYDTMTLIGPGTWAAARGALDAAVTAADLVLAGAPVAYACCRPPGHHVTRFCFGGSCYLNNAAAAAARLRTAGPRPVAVLDIDAHHGNGTQAIFWDDPEVLTGSVHVDPGAGWFPHYLGLRGRDGRWDQPQPDPAARHRRRGMAGGRAHPGRLGAGGERPGAGGRAGRGRGGRRSGEPARRDRRGVPGRRPRPGFARAAHRGGAGGRLRPDHHRRAWSARFSLGIEEEAHG